MLDRKLNVRELYTTFKIYFNKKLYEFLIDILMQINTNEDIESIQKNHNNV